MTLGERDREICRLFRLGASKSHLARQFDLTKNRIGQILRRAGLNTKDHSRPIFGRSTFTATLLTPEVKQALREEAKRTGESMSEIISDAVVAELKRRNVAINSQLTGPQDVPLPLENE